MKLIDDKSEMNWRRKSVVVPLALMLYTIVIACMYIPKQCAADRKSSYITLGISCVLVIILHFVLKKKETVTQQNKERYDKETY